MTRQDILLNIDNAANLEKLYRENNRQFRNEFKTVYPELKDQKLAEFWNERLNYEQTQISWGSRGELTFIIIASLIAGIIAKLPSIFHVEQGYFYMRNAGFIFFPLLTLYFAWKKRLPLKNILIAFSAILISLVFINLFPDVDKSDTLILSCIHLPLFLWVVLGIIFTGDELNNYSARLEFLRFNGDLVIITALLAISGVIISVFTVSLFRAIGLHIENLYFDYFGVLGVSSLPIFGAYITQTNPKLVNKISLVIARIFSPLVLVILSVYLGAVFFVGKNPYHDRDFLIVFNLLLLGVMAIIFFSIAESGKKQNSTANYILFALSLITIIVNGIALSAILFRISEWGFTPNRLAVLGSNLLILANLIVVTIRLFQSLRFENDLNKVEKVISLFLPVYALWTMIIVFVFPVIFQFN